MYPQKEFDEDAEDRLVNEKFRVSGSICLWEVRGGGQIDGRQSVHSGSSEGKACSFPGPRHRVFEGGTGPADHCD